MAGGDTVRWPELLEKFRNTQEKARKRNERIMRGEAAGGLDALGGGPATRSLLALDMDGSGQGGSGGRTSRQSGEQQLSMSAGGAGTRASWARPGSGLGRPMGPPSGVPGLKIPGGGGNQGGGGHVSQGSFSGGAATGGGGAIFRGVFWGGGGGGGGGLGAPQPPVVTQEKGHKSRNSLVGKFASGIARSTGSRERERDGKGKGAK